METFLGGVLIAIVAFAVGHSFGWSGAHSTVATECERLGAFYVGQKTFECKERK